MPEIVCGQSFKPTKLVFENYFISNKNEPSSQFSFIDSLYNPQGIDSLENRLLKELTFSDVWNETPVTKLIIQIGKDSVWWHKTENGKMIGDYRVISKKNSGIIYYYDRSKKINYEKVDIDLTKIDTNLTITSHPDDRKSIHGFDCFKLILVRRDKDNPLENTTYEMYVTDKIDLPAHSVAIGLQIQPGLFPLEVISRESYLPTVAEIYRLIEMK